MRDIAAVENAERAGSQKAEDLRVPPVLSVVTGQLVAQTVTGPRVVELAVDTGNDASGDVDTTSMAAFAVGNGKIADAVNRRTINPTDLYVAFDQSTPNGWRTPSPRTRSTCPGCLGDDRRVPQGFRREGAAR